MEEKQKDKDKVDREEDKNRKKVERNIVNIDENERKKIIRRDKRGRGRKKQL